MQGGINANNSMRSKHTAEDCLARVPYASVMAFFMSVVGVLLFSVMMARAFNASIEQTKRLFNNDELPFLSKIHIFFLVVAVTMGLIAIISLTIGAMSTGATRGEFFRGVKGQFGGRCANILAMILNYASLLCWIFALACTASLCFVYRVFDRLCYPIIRFSDSTCFDFTVFQPLVEPFSSKSLKLCGGDLQQFCALSSTAYLWYIVGFIGSFLTVLGLVHFLICTAANYTHVSLGKKAEELKTLVMSNDMEALNYASKKNYYGDSGRRGGSFQQLNNNYYAS
ncbi:unnamed protein product [Enterobius vermicularis]|uniref:Neuronal membrane glycoprotein M6-b n=1 Tax=Enterobius vermicularis TaxID=51028 RepID=A0A0N4V699_ENTVE|nr:unnamed protein product [Enterobius vermicularis]